ncbi:hypothetical protein [Methylocapsa palsarum]|uniref:Uncharacterized protein n=1 Tax=Methylocapsa palsarum TaxID=1612308 RepID=A0A1I3WS77_9HYPH|nr:hypothetical protein [Methylocapsa palsarum]SFK10504.1 hypothetical protein SAMN05444581_102112 [Methylocapsa palsarum]
MASRFQLIFSVGAALVLCACNATSNGSAPQPVAAAPASTSAKPDWPALPEAAKCTGELNSFQSVLSADVGTGNLNQTVYDQVQTELGKAAQACAAGRDAEAQSLIRATKQRHGYRA